MVLMGNVPGSLCVYNQNTGMHGWNCMIGIDYKDLNACLQVVVMFKF